MTGAATSHPAGAVVDPERRRLAEAVERATPWLQWGPYLSDRQWGTVREDYSPYGTAWDSFLHDHARSRAYRWGEDGLLGISDDQGVLCFALSLWNQADPILKERLFGLTGAGRDGDGHPATLSPAPRRPIRRRRRMPHRLRQEAHTLAGRGRPFVPPHTHIFLRGPDGRRPVFGANQLLQSDPRWRDHLLFYEYIHGDSGAGVGASHQTGWTALVAKLLEQTQGK